MKIITRIGRGKVEHAANYQPETESIQLYCDSLKYESFFAAISDPTEPTSKNVTCAKCLSVLEEGEVND